MPPPLRPKAANHRCPTGKKPWLTKVEANMALANLARTRRARGGVYRCEQCRYWHITRGEGHKRAG